ncbi:hypothetical protein PPYR_12385 [Photinus pyralis]|nr:hypothetical protein PPYR_12385 [Photinus pyralis]
MNYPKAYSYTCNVTNREEVMKTAGKVQNDIGSVTILVNNAGIMPCHPFLEHSAEEIERVMNLNIMAHFWTLQAFLPDMIKHNHGHIVAAQIKILSGIICRRSSRSIKHCTVQRI